MASIAPTIKDNEFQNWLRGALAVLFAKQGLDDFVIGDMSQFQKDLLVSIFTNKSIPAGTTCSKCTIENVLPCKTQNFCSKSGRCKVHDPRRPDKAPNQPCPTYICQDIRVAIHKEHRFKGAGFYGPSWKNTDATKWCTDAFEVAKCFMPPDGYTSVTSLADTDFNGTLAVIINNERFQNKMTARLNLRSNICTEAREVGRLIRHSPNLTLSDNVLSKSIDTLISLLSDPTCLVADPTAQKAVNKLKQLKTNTLTITTADMTTILDNAESQRRDNALQAISTVSKEAQKKIEDKTTEMSLKLLNDVKDSLANIQTVTTASLNPIFTFKISVLDDTKQAGQKEKRELEEKGTSITKKDKLVREADPKQVEKDLTEMKKDLISFYRQNDGIPISPLVEEHKVPLVDFYVQPPLTSIDLQQTFVMFQEKQATQPVHSYRELFSRSDGGIYKNIYVTAKAGIGKTSFAKKLCLTWCQSQDPLECLKEKFESEDVDTMKQFDFLFLIYLRDTTPSVCKLDSMIYKQVISCLAGGHNYSEHFLKDTLQDKICLVVADGLDEWNHSENCESGRKSVHEIPHRPVREHCIVVTTTRPWKLDSARLSTNQIDRHVEINELNENTSKQLVSNAVKLLNTRSHPSRSKSGDEFRRNESIQKLGTMRYVPYILLQLICLWFDGKSVGKSMCQIYSNILELTFSRGLTRIGKDKWSPKRESHVPKPANPPSCLHFKCRKHYDLLLDLGKLAFETLLNINRVVTIVFDKETVLTYISEDRLDIFLKIGLLTQNKDNRYLSCRQKIISFQHKSVQEYFAALYIHSNPESKDIKQKLSNVCKTWLAILDMSNVFVFLGGLNPKACGNILQMLSYNDTENVAEKYRRTSSVNFNLSSKKVPETVRLFQSMNIDIVQEIIDNGQNVFPLYLEDIMIEHEREKSYFLLKHLTEHKIANIKSLYIDERRASDDFTRAVKTFNIHVLNVKSLQKLAFNGAPTQQDLQCLLSGSVRTLSCLSLVCTRDTINNYTTLSPETVRIMLDIDGLLSFTLFGVCLTHSDIVALLKYLSNRPNMTEIGLVNIKCEDHDVKCCDLKLDLSRHQKLQLLALYNINVPNIHVHASSLESLFVGKLPIDACLSVAKCLEDARSLLTLGISDSTYFLVRTVETLPKLSSLRQLAITSFDLGNRVLTIPREMKNIFLIFFQNVKMASTTLKGLIASLDELPHPVNTLMSDCTVTPEEEYQQLKDKMKSSSKYRITYDGFARLQRSKFSFQTVGHTGHR